MSFVEFVENYNTLISWAEYLKLPNIFPKFETPPKKEENGNRLYKQLSIIPIKRIAPHVLRTGGRFTRETSMITPQSFPSVVNSRIWDPQTIVEKKPLKLSK